MTEVALITGSTRGIGLGIAKSLAQEGYHLVINGTRSFEQISDTVEELRKLGARVLYVQANIENEEERNFIFEEIRKEFGKLDVLINNAGIAPRVRNDLLDISLENWDRIMNVNLKGNFFMSQKAAKFMLKHNENTTGLRGIIINITSISTIVASINRPAYCVSKAGLSMVTKLFAARLGKENIPVYELSPGIVETDMTKGVKEKYDILLENDLCIQRRWGQPADVGKAVLGIVKGYLPYSTGERIMIDGGLTISRL